MFQILTCSYYVFYLDSGVSTGMSLTWIYLNFFKVSIHLQILKKIIFSYWCPDMHQMLNTDISRKMKNWSNIEFRYGSSLAFCYLYYCWLEFLVGANIESRFFQDHPPWKLELLFYCLQQEIGCLCNKPVKILDYESNVEHVPFLL